MFWIISAFILGIGTGWGIRGFFPKKLPMRRCRLCGKEVPDEYASRFCPQCGTTDAMVYEI